MKLETLEIVKVTHEWWLKITQGEVTTWLFGHCNALWSWFPSSGILSVTHYLPITVTGAYELSLMRNCKGNIIDLQIS